MNVSSAWWSRVPRSFALMVSVSSGLSVSATRRMFPSR